MSRLKMHEGIEKLEREIWLFEQWLSGLDQDKSKPVDSVEGRIRNAYIESIVSRKQAIAELEGA